MTDLHTTVEERDTHVVLRLRGEVDMANTGRLGEEIRRQVDNTTFALALDLTEVSYFDSAGVRLLFELAERLRSRRQELVVAASPGTLVEQVLHIVALETVAIVAGDVDSGLARVAIAPRD